MMLLAVTTETWVVTGLGFGMVLVLLFVFVYIMKGLGAIMNRATAGTKKAETKVADDATKAAIATTLALDKDSEEMAAVAMALDMYQTLPPGRSFWVLGVMMVSLVMRPSFSAARIML